MLPSIGARVSTRLSAYLRHIGVPTTQRTSAHLAGAGVSATALSALGVRAFSSSQTSSSEASASSAASNSAASQGAESAPAKPTIDSELRPFRLSSPSVTLSFVPPPSAAGDTTAAAARTPMRIAVASTGISKDKFNFNTQRWTPTALPNFAALGEDAAASLRDDAVGIAHASPAPASRNPAVPPPTPQCAFQRGDATVVPAAAATVVEHPYATVDAATAAQATDPALYFNHTFTPAPVLAERAHAVSAVALSVSDGVGGMQGEPQNDTPLMSHELMRNVRRVLRPDSPSAKAVLTDAYALLTQEGKPRVGACTGVVTLVAPHPTDPERLRFTAASIGDSICVAFRPRYYLASEAEGRAGKFATRSHAVPLAQSWPMDYGIAPGNEVPTPVQFVTQRGAGTSIPLDSEDLGVDPFADEPTPWLASETTAELKRGDVIVVMTDGVSDNLPGPVFAQTLSSLYSSVVFKTTGMAPLSLARGGFFGPGVAALPAVSAADNVSADQEALAAGNAAELFAGLVVRSAMTQPKVDDISVVVGVVY